MTAIKIIVIWGIGSLLASLIGGIAAYRKRRDHSAWAAWCFIFPPLLLVLLLLRRNPGVRPRQPTLDEQDHDSEWA